MKIRTYLQCLLIFTSLTCLQPGKGFAQVLMNTSWRPIDNLSIALKNNGIDTLTITFLPNDKMEFRYYANSSTTTSYGLWWQLAPGHFRFRDTSNSGLSAFCDPDDDAYVQYTIDTGVMHFANMQDSCGTRGALFTDSKWALVDNNVSIIEAYKTGPDIQIYPNPGAGSLHIDMKGQGADKFNINIYDLYGRMILNLRDISANESELTIPPLPTGTYLARIESGVGRPVISRLLIQN